MKYPTISIFDFMKRIFLIGAALILSALLIAYLISIGKLRFNYPDKNEFLIVGIDISHHQGNIRWEELKTENISFVIIKATEGGDYKDPLFKTNWVNSKKEGYKTGAYHFYRICKDGKEQAKNFIETVPNDEDNLPASIDLEFGGNCKTDKPSEQILKEVNDFLEAVENHYHKRPIIYATQEFYDQFLVGQFKNHPIWIRDIYGKPKLSDGRDWLLWQFANRGHLQGIDTYVDLNVLNGKSVEILN
jgi:lysozyme